MQFAFVSPCTNIPHRVVPSVCFTKRQSGGYPLWPRCYDRSETLFFPPTQRRGAILPEEPPDASTLLQAKINIDLFPVFTSYVTTSCRVGKVFGPITIPPAPEMAYGKKTRSYIIPQYVAIYQHLLWGLALRQTIIHLFTFVCPPPKSTLAVDAR